MYHGTMNKQSLPRHEAAARFIKMTWATWEDALIYLGSPAITDSLSDETIIAAVNEYMRDEYERVYDL